MSTEYNKVLNDYTKNINQFLFELDLFIDKITEKSIDINKGSNGNSEFEKIIQDDLKEISSNSRNNIKALIEFLSNIKQAYGGLRYSDILNLFISNRTSIKTGIRDLGLKFMKYNLSRIPQNKGLLKAISNDIWFDIISQLRNNDNFMIIVNKSLQFFNRNLEEQANKQIKKALIEYPKLSQDDINKFKIEYKKSRLTFEDFLKSNLNIEKKEEINPNRQIILEDEPEEDINVDEVMSTYLNADDRLLARIRRTGKLPDKQTQRRVKKKSETL